MENLLSPFFLHFSGTHIYFVQTYLQICHFVNTKSFCKLVSILMISEMLFQLQDVIFTEKEEVRTHMIELFGQKLEENLM